LQDLSKFTQIWIFGFKTYHLATLHEMAIQSQLSKFESKSKKATRSIAPNLETDLRIGLRKSEYQPSRRSEKRGKSLGRSGRAGRGGVPGGQRA
jgi:hypothetical protein